jgi:capping protein beta
MIVFYFCIEVAIDMISSREYLKHEYNRDGESYRSPWSNKFFPEAPDCEFFPSPVLLSLEQKMNDVFAQYV